MTAAGPRHRVQVGRVKEALEREGHLVLDPEDFTKGLPESFASEIKSVNYSLIRRSHFAVFVLGDPSFGIGGELEYCRAAGIPTATIQFDDRIRSAWTLPTWGVHIKIDSLISELRAMDRYGYMPHFRHVEKGSREWKILRSIYLLP